MNDSVTREAISRAEERKFLRFVKEDPHFAGIMRESTYCLKQVFVSRNFVV